MIYIVHGEDNSKSRALILNQQKKLNIINKKEVLLDDIDIKELEIMLNSNSLFGEPAFFVIDITKTKGDEKHIEILSKKPNETVVILYSEKTLTKTNIFIKNMNLLNAKVVENTIVHNENIFKFVDVLFSKNRQETYKEYEKLIKANTDDFYIMSMIYYGMRNIAKCIYNSPSFEKSSPFTKTKTIQQSKKYNEVQIKNIYANLYKLEKEMKLGQKDTNIVVTMAIENVLNSK